jgi:hypothetical protein
MVRAPSRLQQPTRGILATFCATIFAIIFKKFFNENFLTLIVATQDNHRLKLMIAFSNHFHIDFSNVCSNRHSIQARMQS